MAPPDFAKNTDMVENLDYKTGLDFGGHMFLKNPRLIGGLIRYPELDDVKVYDRDTHL